MPEPVPARAAIAARGRDVHLLFRRVPDPVPLVGARSNTGAVAYDEDLANRLRETLPGEPGLTEKRMFGGLAFLINGNLAVIASSQGGVLLRVDPAHTDALLREPPAQPFVMRGRELDGWLRLDTRALEADADFERWVRLGVSYAQSLPPK